MVTVCASTWRASVSVTAAPGLRKASSRSRCSNVAKSNSVMVKVRVDGRNVISVPVRAPPSATGASPTTFKGDSTSPSPKRTTCALPSRQMCSSSHSDRALTTETPTPCRPPETLYES